MERLQRGRARVGAECEIFQCRGPIFGGFNGAAPAWARSVSVPDVNLDGAYELQRGRARVGAEWESSSRNTGRVRSGFNGAAPAWARSASLSASVGVVS